MQAHYGAAAGAFMWGLEALINSERQIRAILTGGWGSGDERKALADLDAFDAAHGTALAA
ncbi:hypothetical protein BURC_03711 [Burkholderiaceae bacterium]|nr:hypothetical protein BURC_03711 [Burkholderiaceae bacterium]